jgi:hypothetical protein
MNRINDWPFLFISKAISKINIRTNTMPLAETGVLIPNIFISPLRIPLYYGLNDRGESK